MRILERRSSRCEIRTDTTSRSARSLRPRRWRRSRKLGRSFMALRRPKFLLGTPSLTKFESRHVRASFFLIDGHAIGGRHFLTR